jgi:predicted heme/steroid binding protein
LGYIKTSKLNEGVDIMKRSRKQIAMVVLLLLIMSVVVACGSNSKEVAVEDLPEFTLEELAQYTGKDGKAAYIAVDGIVYDVTKVPQWKNGFHNGYTAGKDLTEEIKTKSPHGVSKLKNVKIIGRLAK